MTLGDTFYKGPAGDRDALYFGKDKRARTKAKKKKGLYALFQEIKTVSGDILRLNEKNMKDVDVKTKRLARSSLIWYGLGLACGIVLAVFLVGNTIRMIVHPVRAATESAVAIGAGNLDQVVPITSDDELGQLASAFNTMARQLREFRQIAQGPIDPRPADEPGHDRFLSGAGPGGRSGGPRGDGQSGRAPPLRPAAAGHADATRRRVGSLRKPCGNP